MVRKNKVKYKKYIVTKQFKNMLKEKKQLSLYALTAELGMSVSDAFNSIKRFIDMDILEDCGDGNFNVKADDSKIDSLIAGREEWNTEWTYDELTEKVPDIFKPKYCFVMKKLSEIGSIRVGKALDELKYALEMSLLKYNGVISEKDGVFYSLVSEEDFNEFLEHYITLTGNNPLLDDTLKNSPDERQGSESSDLKKSRKKDSSLGGKEKKMPDFNFTEDELKKVPDIEDIAMDIEDYLNNGFDDIPDEEENDIKEDKEDDVPFVQSVTRDTVLSKKMTYMNFGSYPQKEITKKELINALNKKSGRLPSKNKPNGWNLYDYYAKSEDPENCWWYKDMTYKGNKYRGVYFTAWREEGEAGYLEYEYPCYEMKKVYWFEFQPIRWSILWVNKGTLLVMSDTILDSQPFNSMVHNDNPDYEARKFCWLTSWEESTMREWLNTEFLDMAFTEEEKEMIVRHKVVTESLIGDIEKTNDSVFLPGIDELTVSEMGFEEDEDLKDYVRLIYPSDYAVCQGLKLIPELDSGMNGKWWLRTGANAQDQMCIVDSQGRITQNTNVDSTTIGVVPGMIIKRGNYSTY